MRRLSGLILLALMALSLISCSNRQSEWRSKITVNVETPNGIVSGSSVTREVASLTSGALVPPEARGGGHGRFGEAVVVEVAPGKYLFALLPGSMDTAPELDAAHVFFPGQPPADTDAKFATLRESRQIPANLYPMLVTFDDINVPASVKLVDPKNIAASFGAGYRLKDMTLEITDEAVTDGSVDSVLPWLAEHKGRLKPTSKTNLRDVSPEENLRRSNFKDIQP